MITRLKRWWRRTRKYSDWHDTPCNHGLDCDEILYYSTAIGGWHFPAMYHDMGKTTNFEEHEHYVVKTKHRIYECPECERHFLGPQIGSASYIHQP